MTRINIYQTEENQPPASEYAERKGIGHPDTLMDGICEQVSIELCKYYLDHFGHILHHNVDKALLVGGASEVSLGHGKITKPVEIILAGRAIQNYQGADIPTHKIAITAAKNYLRTHTRFLDVDKEVLITSKISKGSEDLIKIFTRGSTIPLANDTSFGVGFAPFTKEETLAYEIERFLNSAKYKEKRPAAGEDIKVLCLRQQRKFSAYIAIAFVGPLIKNMDEYKDYKKKIAEDVRNFCRELVNEDVDIFINHGDSEKTNAIYITKSGLSCESGDDGEVGRGNRVNGLITPFRAMSLEAAAGKNPISHTGKLYNILATTIAREIVKEYPQVLRCTVYMLSTIGTPINTPTDFSISLIMKEGESIDPIKANINEIAKSYLANIPLIFEEIVTGKHAVF